MIIESYWIRKFDLNLVEKTAILVLMAMKRFIEFDWIELNWIELNWIEPAEEEECASWARPCRAVQRMKADEIELIYRWMISSSTQLWNK